MERKSVLVMLAAYNGSEHIIEQIDSILNQVDVCVHVLVRDDNSQDGTVALVRNHYSEDGRVELIESRKNLGCAKSFMDLVFAAGNEFDYYAFSDQDDYWKPDKLIRAVSALEKASNDSKSVLYCCNRDEVNVDRVFLYRNVPVGNNEHVKSIEYLMFVRNIAPGNSMVFSPAFLDRLKLAKDVDFPTGFYHDYWIHLVAACLEDTAVIYDLDYCGLERRITGKNLAGIDRTHRQGVRSLARRFNSYQAGSLQSMVDQLLEKYDGLIDDRIMELLGLFENAESLKSRIKLIRRSGEVKFDSLKGRLFSLYKLSSGIV